MLLQVKNPTGGFSDVGTDGTGVVTGVPISTPSTRVGAHTTNASVDTAVTLTRPATASAILIQATVQNVRYTLDAVAPTTSTGFRLTSGNDPILIPVGTADTLKVISETAGAEVHYQWYV